MPFTPRLAAALMGVAVFSSVVAARDYRVTVAPADVARAAQVIAFPLPADAPKVPVLRGAGGLLLPVQVETGGAATFVLPAQAAGETITLTLQAASGGQTTRGVSVHRETGRLRV
jgi:hypothetical protein